MDINKYPISIAWSEEDGEYVATCPAFPGLSALGETEEKALAEAKVALDLFIKSCEERGIPLPEPQAVREYSGQTRLRISKTLHRLAAQRAEEEGESLNQYFAGAVQMRVAGEQVGSHFLAEIRQVLAEQTRQNQIARNLMEQRLTGQMARHGIAGLGIYIDGTLAQREGTNLSDFNQLRVYGKRLQAISAFRYEGAGGNVRAVQPTEELAANA